MDVGKIQASLKELGLEAWLLYDFKGSNAIARHIIGLGSDRFTTRRWFGLIPAEGEPTWLHSAIEAHLFTHLPGRRIAFVGLRELQEKLRATLKGISQVAMEYVPGGAIPYISLVDGGTLEMVRAAGPKVTSSADLVQHFEARWTAEGLASHRRAAQALTEVRQATYDEVMRTIASGKTQTEHRVQQFMMEQFRQRRMFAEPPIVAVNANSGNPHYEPTPNGSATLKKGDLLLLDLWCREEKEGSIWADITWMAYLGSEVPDQFLKVWDIVAGARDAAVAFLKEATSRGKTIHGAEVDEVARGHIRKHGYEDRFLHRTGHSIGFEVHGNGCNIDGLETIDGRRLIPQTGFSIEPGIYLKEFGIRSEIDVYIGDNGAEVTTDIQDSIVPLGGHPLAGPRQ